MEPIHSEIGRASPEVKKKDSREEVLSSFNSSFELLNNIPDEELTTEERWVKKSLQRAKEDTLDKGKGKRKISFENHHTEETFSQLEGIPITGLLDFVQKKIDSLPDGEEKTKLTEARSVLIRNSKEYYKLPHRLDPSRMEGRVHQEAYFISKDERATGDEVKDYYMAADLLLAWRELAIPPTSEVVAEETPNPEPIPAEPGEPTPPTTEPTSAPSPESSEPALSPPTVDEVIREQEILIGRMDDLFRKEAFKQAEIQLREEIRRGTIFNPLNWARKISLRVAEQYFRQKLAVRAETMMRANNNAYGEYDLIKNAVKTADARRAEFELAQKATLETAKYLSEAGTSFEGQRVEEASGLLKDKITADVLKPIVEGRITDRNQVQKVLTEFVRSNASDSQVEALFGRNASDFGKLADYFASNVFEVGERMKADVEAHKYSLDRINEFVKIRLANIRQGEETQVNLTAVDKAVRWAEKHRLTGILINPATIGAGFSLGTFAFIRTTGVGAGAASIAVPLAGLLPGAAFAAARRNYDLKMDFAAHSRETAAGGQVGPGSPRREALEKIVEKLQRAKAKDLINGGGQELLGGQPRINVAELLSSDLSIPVNMEAALRRYAEIKGRLDFSVREHVDLITFDSNTTIVGQRLELMRAVSQLRQVLLAKGVPQTELDRFLGQTNSKLIQNKEEQDREFRNYRVKEAIKSGAIGGAVGLASGLAIQEGIAVAGRAMGNNVSQTVLEGIVGYKPQAHTEFVGTQTTITPPQEVTSTQTETVWETVKGEMKTTTDPMEHFRGKGEVEKALRMLWHDNDTPMHLNERGILVGADGKELQFHHHALSDGSIDLDMSKMISTQKGVNWDLSIDSQYSRVMKDIVQNPDGSRIYKNFEFLITPNDAANAAREVIRIKVDENGHAIIPKGVDLRSFFEVKDGKVVQLAKFIEVAHNEFNKDGNLAGRTILATSVGQGIDNITITVPTEEMIPHQQVITETQVIPGEETTTPVFAEKPWEYPMIIPIPAAPRFPLEPLQAIGFPPPPEVYYSGESLASTREWLAKHPEAHREYVRKKQGGKWVWTDKEGGLIVRNVSREREEIKRFLDGLKTSDPEHFALISSLKEKVAPMSPKTRAAVNIPAWMEGKNLYRLLQEYSKQVDKNGNLLDPDLFEINIIVNRKTGTPSDESVSEIERFKTDAERAGRVLHINYVDVELPEDRANVGNARRIITNLTLLRSLARDNQYGPLYIESEDADLLDVDPNTVSNIITKLDRTPHLDAVRGIQDRTPSVMMENDFLFLYRRMQDFKELLLRRAAFRPENNPRYNFNWNRVITGGWNTAYTAEAYVLTGGYNPYQTKGEDMMIGERISMLRGDGTIPNTYVVGKVASRSNSSPRRYIYEVASGKAAYGESFEDPAVNERIRTTPPEELMRLISNFSRVSERNKATFENMINNEYAFIKTMTPNGGEATKVTSFIMTWLGFKKSDYEFGADGRIKITNIENVKNALEDYRKRHKVDEAAVEDSTAAEIVSPAAEASETSSATVAREGWLRRKFKVPSMPSFRVGVPRPRVPRSTIGIPRVRGSVPRPHLPRRENTPRPPRHIAEARAIRNMPREKIAARINAARERREAREAKYKSRTRST